MRSPARVGVSSKKKLDEVKVSAHLIRELNRLCFVLADAEKQDYDSDNGGRSKKRGDNASKKQSTVASKKRPARSPPPTNNKKKKR